MLRWCFFLVALLLCLAESRFFLQKNRAILVMATDAPPAGGGQSRVDPLLASLTPDDLARGVWALSREPDGLSADQRQKLQTVLSEGTEIRRRIEVLRVQREAARRQWLADGAEIGVWLGTARLPKGNP